MESNGDLENLRMMTKVSHLYHSKGIVQTDIAKRLSLSQARVSRLLSAAENQGIVKRIVISPAGLFSEMERELEERFGLVQAHVIDASVEDENELVDSLGVALASVFHLMPIDGKSIGFTSWSRSMRAFVNALSPFPKVNAKQIVEMLGGVGQPSMQHLATVATESLATLTGARTVFLRIPGVVSSIEMRDALLSADSHAREALGQFNSLDVALVGIAPASAASHLDQGSNFFSQEQFSHAREQGAVGEINLRFLDSEGNPTAEDLNDLVIGISLEQLKNVGVKIGVSGGKAKHEATLAALRGGWLDILVTNTDTAKFLLSTGEGEPKTT